MEKTENPNIIKYFYLKSQTTTSTSPSYSTAKQWVSEFKKKVARPLMTHHFQAASLRLQVSKWLILKNMMEERRLEISEIAETTSTSNERARNIKHEHICIKKLSARWISCLLTLGQELTRETVSKSRRILAVELLKPNTSKTMVWAGEPMSKKVKTIFPKIEIMATVFCGANEIIFVDYLQKDKMIPRKTIQGYYSV